ncbi:acyltransferase family protein [Mycobacterium shigaense]|uniref:Acyltransferase n=1 Tax=Mycobacterium shigaense TaxID=722731 RepID=A0A1Z4EDS9_9MYCO|nr:acyltransferase [Mycobacterium shigaense]MEA1124285.1 acyltransferase [Mycobacterium shigaense]PRI13504.1 acyltransferase [Mycobacterium shigaense]BAX91131.1 acyltransferase [Mycobacterium shigaense]
MKLGQVFDPQNNALNAWRLVLAAEVILWHSFPLTGHFVSSAPARQLLFSLGVDGFFAVSGFLVTASWLHHPRVRDYSKARALRIFPGFYTCLIVIAFVFAPLSEAIQGGSPGRVLSSKAPFEYVLMNCTLVILKPDVGGTPRHVPSPGVWNVSLWTLIWEMFCYIAVAAFGVAGLLNRRWFLPTVMVAAAVSAAALPPMTFPGVWTIQQAVARFAMMFAAGALLNRFKDVVPARWSLVGLCLAIVGAASLMPDYRVVGALPLAYAIIVSGSLVHSRRLRLRTDLSYGVYIYAFPMQQLLIVCGLGGLAPLLFFPVATVATLPLAALSWFLVEKPALSLKSRILREPSAAAQPAAVGDT